jgi:hypothetical protein
MPLLFTQHNVSSAAAPRFVTAFKRYTYPGFQHLATVYDRAHPRVKRTGSSE